MIASTAYAAHQAKRSSDVQAAEIEKQADQERISAEGRELERRQRLNKVLAANIVGQSTSGMSGEGTPASIALESAKQASLSEGMESLSDRLKQSQMKRQAANVKSAGKTQAASLLLQGASRTQELS